MAVGLRSGGEHDNMRRVIVVDDRVLIAGPPTRYESNWGSGDVPAVLGRPRPGEPTLAIVCDRGTLAAAPLSFLAGWPPQAPHDAVLRVAEPPQARRLRQQAAGTRARALAAARAVAAYRLDPDPDWRSRAACAGDDPAIWHDRSPSRARALDVCARCHVRIACLSSALGEPERRDWWTTIRGGLPAPARRRAAEALAGLHRNGPPAGGGGRAEASADR